MPGRVTGGCRTGRAGRGRPDPRARSRQATEPVRPSQLDPAAGPAAGLGARHRAGARRRPLDWHRRGAGPLRRHRLHRLPPVRRRPAGQPHHHADRGARRVHLGRHAGRRVAASRRPLHQLHQRQRPRHADRQRPVRVGRRHHLGGRRSPRHGLPPRHHRQLRPGAGRARRGPARAGASRADGLLLGVGFADVVRFDGQRFHRYANPAELADSFGAVVDRRSRGRALGGDVARPGVHRSRRAGARRYTVADGVPAVPVRAAIVDRDGTLWIGTPNGLARREGDRFVRVSAPRVSGRRVRVGPVRGSRRRLVGRHQQRPAPVPRAAVHDVRDAGGISQRQAHGGVGGPAAARCGLASRTPVSWP